MNASLAPSVQTLLALFEDGPLRDVRFPGADGASLAAAAESVHAANVAAAQAELALEAARVALAQKTAELAQLAERITAYARVFAADKPELLAKLPAPARSVARVKRRAADVALSAEGAGSKDAPPSPDTTESSAADGTARRGRPRNVRTEEPRVIPS